ncbi:hypothetical protein BH10ACI2_BH10ACI2_08570 [soil metagenome]
MRQTDLKLKLGTCFLLVALYSLSTVAQPPDKVATSDGDLEYAAAAELFQQRTADSLKLAVSKFEKAIQFFRTSDEKAKEADAELLAGRSCEFLGDNSKATGFYNDALKLAITLKIKPLEAILLNNLGLVAKNAGDNAKATAKFEQSLAAAVVSGDAAVEALVLSNLGNTVAGAGDKGRALDYLRRALELAEKIDNKGLQASTLTNVGKIFADSGKKTEAIGYYNKSLNLSREVKDNSQTLINLNNLGAVYLTMNEPKKTLDYFTQAFELAKVSPDKNDLIIVYNNLGGYYDQIGEKTKALEYFTKVLSLAKEAGNLDYEGYISNNIGLIYYTMGDYREAIKYCQRALTITDRTKDAILRTRSLNNVGMAHLAMGELELAADSFVKARNAADSNVDPYMVATILSNIGLVYISLDMPQKAIDIYGQLLPITEQLGEIKNKAAALNNLGRAYQMLGERVKAENSYSRSLATSRSIGDADLEAMSLNNLMVVWAELKNPGFGIFFGKQAVNSYQLQRSNIKDLDPSLQKSYLARVSLTYRSLAAMLIDNGRLSEAEQVLGMLKQEEVFEYLRRDASETDKLGQRSDLRGDEATALKRYDEIAGKVSAIGVEFGKLQTAKSSLADGQTFAPADQKRYDELSKQLEDANTAFQVFLRQLADEFAKKPKVVDDIQENAGLQADLKSWGEGVVSLYTVVGDDRYRVILTTPNVQTDGKTEITAAALNRKINDFRVAVQNPKIDPRPLGKELYDIIVKPIEKQLEGSKAKTLLWSLDGTLRYLPLAALWDGKQYFGEKYENVLITLASRTRLSDEPKGDWRVLGLGVTGAKDVPEPNGTRTIHFSALPSVQSELDAIVNDKQSQTEKGVLDGKLLIDGTFNEQSLKDQLGKGFKAIHIASHFSFRPGDMTKSFLLLGDGSPLTMDKIKTSPQLKFTGVELLVLSACQTAVGEADASGKEIESFGVIAQQNGAKAVMATLWSVADDSTAILMSEFYRIKKETPAISKSEALQRAQTNLMAGKYEISQLSKKRADQFVGPANGTTQPSFVPDPKAPYAHPFYWAPFILIGNWR